LPAFDKRRLHLAVDHHFGNTSLFRLPSLLMQLHAVSLVPIWVAQI